MSKPYLEIYLIYIKNWCLVCCILQFTLTNIVVYIQNPCRNSLMDSLASSQIRLLHLLYKQNRTSWKQTEWDWQIIWKLRFQRWTSRQIYNLAKKTSLRHNSCWKIWPWFWSNAWILEVLLVVQCLWWNSAAGHLVSKLGRLREKNGISSSSGADSRDSLNELRFCL